MAAADHRAPPARVGEVVGQLMPVVIPLAGLLFLLWAGGLSLVQAVGRFTLEAPFSLNLTVVGVAVLVLGGVVAAALRVVALIRTVRPAHPRPVALRSSGGGDHPGPAAPVRPESTSPGIPEPA